MSDITAERVTATSQRSALQANSSNDPTMAAIKAGFEGPNEAGQTELFLEGADWESVADAIGDETLIINMGPQHPSTHGVLRLVLELDGEVVVGQRRLSCGRVAHALTAWPSKDSPRIFACSLRMPSSSISGRGGQPGTYMSTGTTWSTPWTSA